MKTAKAKWVIWLQLVSLILFFSSKVNGRRPCGRLLRNVKLPAHTKFESRQRKANRAVLVCDKGFYFSEGKNRLSLSCTGLKNLISSDQIPKCKGCGDPPSVKNGAVIFSATSVGSVAFYYCSAGFSLMGLRKQRKCRGNLRWSGGRSRISCEIDYSECGVSPFKPFDARARKPRVVGGKTTNERDWPWAVKIFVQGRLVCGGTLINQQFVLTSANCFDDGPSIVEVQVQFHDQAKNKTFQKINALVIHPDYNKTDFRNDIALLKIPKLNRFTRNQRAICLPRKVNITRTNRNGNNMYVVGWGKTTARKPGNIKGKNSKDLKHVKLPFRANKICADNVKNKANKYKKLAWYFNSTTQFCAGYVTGKRDACQGDGGGPAMVLQQHPVSRNWRWFQVGIVSWGYGCAQVGEVSYYTKVSAFVDWINEIVAKS